MVTAQKKAEKGGAASKSQKAAAARTLVHAEGSQCFWTVDGQILQNLLELRDALNRMPDEVFFHHVTPDRNDFANWVNEVLMDAEVSTKLRKAKKPSAATSAVVTHLKCYTL